MNEMNYLKLIVLVCVCVCVLKLPRNEKYIDLQSQAIYVDDFFFKKRLHISKDSGSSVQVDILNT